MALKAGLVNNPPRDDEEGRLYTEFERSKPAPQGICVANSAGKVLDWALMFDGDKSVLEFLDQTLIRYSVYPDAEVAFPARRYMRYPSQTLADVEDSGTTLPVPERHAKETRCIATPGHPKGTLDVRLWGRALGEDGKPLADTVRQEHYVEDRFTVPVEVQDQLARAAADAGRERFRLPPALQRSLVSQAYLGQLDVNPCMRGKESGEWEFWGRAVGGDAARIRVTGRSEVSGGESRSGRRSDGRLWSHEIKLTWDGYIEMKEDRITRLLLTAEGREKLKWGNKRMMDPREADVQRLPAGHPIDLSCGVRYGIEGKPVSKDQIGEGRTEGPPASLQRKMRRVQNLMQENRRPEGLSRIMRRFEAQIRRRAFKKAEALLDEALELFEDP